MVALIVLIMRISHLNEKIDMLDEQLSDLVTHEFLNEKYSQHSDTTILKEQVSNLRHRISSAQQSE